MRMTIRETEIHVLESEPLEGTREPSLLFIHGAGGDASVWDEQASFFSGMHRVFRVELPGHGQSRGTGEGEISAYAEWVREVLEVGLPETPIVLVGHSMGGAIALHLALHPPPNLKGTVLVGTGARLGVLPGIFQMLENDPEAFLKTIDLVAYGPSASPQLRHQGTEMIRRCSTHVILKDFGACNRFDVRAHLHQIHLPTLIICGEEDKLTPVKFASFMREHIPDSQLTLVPEAGHMVMEEKPAAVNEAIQNFLSSLPS